MKKKVILPDTLDLNKVDLKASPIESFRNSEVETIMQKIVADHYEDFQYSLDLYFYGDEWTAKIQYVYVIDWTRDWRLKGPCLKNLLIRVWYFLDGLKTGKVSPSKHQAKLKQDEEHKKMEKELAAMVDRGEI
tara:strand:+ start:370 stop:768 length:399 start_codon:yes stop_codon:yes gene_type:complete